MTSGEGSVAQRHAAEEPEELTPRGTGPRVVMVAAYADNRVIGRDGDMPWHLSEDLKHFRATTQGHTVVMGRVTYEGIGHPLPYRTNVVVTRSPGWTADGVLVADSLEAALRIGREVHAETGADIVIGGGTQVYEAAMRYATHQVLTEVHQSPEGDAHYPDFDPAEWRETRREDRDGFSWVWWERTTAPEPIA